MKQFLVHLERPNPVEWVVNVAGPNQMRGQNIQYSTAMEYKIDYHLSDDDWFKAIDVET